MLQQKFKISINIQFVCFCHLNHYIEYYTSIHSFYGSAEQPVFPSHCEWTDCVLIEIAVSGKVILQPHGKVFLYDTVSTFLHYMVKTFFYPLWKVLSEEEVSNILLFVYWKAVHKRGELYADENTDVRNTESEINRLHKNGYHLLL